MEIDFSDIKYYEEDDLQAALARLVEEPNLWRVCRFLNPNTSNEAAIAQISSYSSVKDFQINFILQVIKKLVAESVDQLTSNGAEHYSSDLNQKYVFITNHRNIVMDASIVNLELYNYFLNNYESTAIAIGNNLLNIPWVKDLARLNKCFVVIRDASVQQMLENSKKLSQYIRQLITENKSSVWIAQREGRTKDGNDFTQQGVLKMFQMSANEDFVENFSQLRIAPVAISYEYDPCVREKVIELATIENTGEFVKGPLDDFNSMYNGIMGYKGRIHINFGPAISEDWLKKINPDLPKNEKIKQIAEYIDDFIWTHYHLWPNNYIATDLLNQDTQFASHYSAEEKAKFIELMHKKLDGIEGNPLQHEQIFLKMFANVVKNAHRKSDQFQFKF
jgi:1-acyl-sn-glycerol-3-phosphate acyltransferase